jgi:hypothetical protein
MRSRSAAGQRRHDLAQVTAVGGENALHASMSTVEGRQPPSFARSRSTNFWILPVEVFGSGPKTTWRGTL